MSFSRAETLLQELESKDKSNKKVGTGRLPTEKDRTGGDVVDDPVKLKKYQREYAIYAYFRLVKLTNNLPFQKYHQKEYMELNKYLYEVSFGKPAQTVIADLGEHLPLNVMFQIAPKPKELTNGKTDRAGTDTERSPAGSKETS